MKLYVFCMLFLASSCYNNNVDRRNKTVKLSENFIDMLGQYDSMYMMGTEYDNEICASPWPDNMICISGIQKDRPNREYLFKTTFNGKSVFFITGLELLVSMYKVKNDRSDSSISIYDPPILCFERQLENNYVVCEDRYKCWHCTWPPPPPAEPIIKYEPEN